MKASSLELLTKSQLPQSQAQAILQAMDEELATRDSSLATKSDLALTTEILRREIRDAEGRMLRWNFAFWVAQLAAVAGLLKLVR